MHETNWSGNFAYTAQTLHSPSSVAELQTIVRKAASVHVLGSRHTFNAIADARELISLEQLPQDVTLDAALRTATVPARVTYGALASQLDAQGWALPNLASLPHVSVAGAVATGTHGSGNRNGSLPTAVSGIELVTSEGELVQARRGDADFEGMVVHLGALGAVTRLTLDIEPTYTIRQTVFERLSWSALREHFDALTASGYSVSLFSNWGDSIDQVWVKTRAVAATGASADARQRAASDSRVRADFGERAAVVSGVDADLEELFGARAARTELHPVPGMDPVNCTPQQGRPGPWWTRLTHFRLEHQPSVGEELHAEYMLDRQNALAAIDVVRGFSERIQPLLLSAEIRTVAADSLWLSPMYQRESVCLHFTWRLLQPEVEALLVDLEAALEPFEPRPHWGKLFAATAEAIAPRYPRMQDFLRLKARLDPRGAFTNDWFRAHVNA